MEILRNTNGYILKKVKRNFEGSYAIIKDGEQSKTQFNTSTVKKALLKMSDDDFEKFAKERLS